MRFVKSLRAFLHASLLPSLATPPIIAAMSHSVADDVIEEKINQVASAIESYISDHHNQPAMMTKFNPDLHFQSDDQIARRYAMRSTIQASVAGMEDGAKSEARSLTRTEKHRAKEQW